MTEAKKRTWDNGNMRFHLGEIREGFWILSARRISDDAHVWDQIHLANGEGTERELETLMLHKLAKCLEDGPSQKCYACEATLTADLTNANYQFDNAMWVKFSGGYGMFVESSNYREAPDEVVICHDCAHELCQKIPWINKLITPHSSHSHRTQWKDAHPDHWGWDYDTTPDPF